MGLYDFTVLPLVANGSPDRAKVKELYGQK